VHCQNCTFGGLDKRIFDIFSIAHFLFGVVMGMSGLHFVYLVGATVVWELVEITTVGFGEKETLVNRFGDITIAVAGWLLVRGVTVHTFPML